MSVSMRVMMLLFPIIVLSGCSVFSPVQTGPVTKYALDTTPQSIVRKSSNRMTLLVTQPESNPIYNTADMAYTTRSHQVSYFAKNSWVDKPGKMLQPLITQTLQNTGYFHAIVTPPFSGQYDFSLNTQLVELEQDFFGGRSVVNLIVRAQLVKKSNGHVIAAKQFAVSEPAPQNNPYGGVVAANRATARLLQQLAAFCVHKL